MQPVLRDQVFVDLWADLLQVAQAPASIVQALSQKSLCAAMWRLGALGAARSAFFVECAAFVLLHCPLSTRAWHRRSYMQCLFCGLLTTLVLYRRVNARCERIWPAHIRCRRCWAGKRMLLAAKRTLLIHSAGWWLLQLLQELMQRWRLYSGLLWFLRANIASSRQQIRQVVGRTCCAKKKRYTKRCLAFPLRVFTEAVRAFAEAVHDNFTRQQPLAPCTWQCGPGPWGPSQRTVCLAHAPN